MRQKKPLRKKTWCKDFFFLFSLYPSPFFLSPEAHLFSETVRREKCLVVGRTLPRPYDACVVRIVGCFPFAAISSVPALRAGSRRCQAAAENGQRQGLSAVRLGAVPFTGSVTTRGRAGQCSAETQTGAGNRGVPRVQGEEDEVQ